MIELKIEGKNNCLISYLTLLCKYLIIHKCLFHLSAALAELTEDPINRNMTFILLTKNNNKKQTKKKIGLQVPWKFSLTPLWPTVLCCSYTYGGCLGVFKHPLFDLIFFFFIIIFVFACLLVREVGDVWGYPYPVSGKLTIKFWWRKKKKKVSESTAINTMLDLQIYNFLLKASEQTLLANKWKENLGYIFCFLNWKVLSSKLFTVFFSC